MFLRKLSDQQKVDIFNEYTTNEKITCYDLGRKYGVKGESISVLLKRRGVKIRNDQSILKRKFSLNQHYFSIIDTEAKAYFLGLLYADGCNRDQNNSVAISLQRADKDILELFIKELNYGGELKIRRRSLKNPNHQDSYCLSISSRIMCEDLTKLGCHPRKSFTLEFPTEEQVPSYLLHHFMRGYFDGDGSFLVGSKNGQITIISTERFCEKVKFIIKDKLNVNCSIYRPYNSRVDKSKTTRTLAIGGRFQVERFLEWIYKDSNFRLERKYNRYKNWYATQKH